MLTHNGKEIKEIKTHRQYNGKDGLYMSNEMYRYLDILHHLKLSVVIGIDAIQKETSKLNMELITIGSKNKTIHEVVCSVLEDSKVLNFGNTGRYHIPSVPLTFDDFHIDLLCNLTSRLESLKKRDNKYGSAIVISEKLLHNYGEGELLTTDFIRILETVTNPRYNPFLPVYISTFHDTLESVSEYLSQVGKRPTRWNPHIIIYKNHYGPF